MLDTQAGSWLHELVTGAILANIVTLGSILKWGFKFYNQHEMLWKDLLERQAVKEQRIKGKVRLRDFD